jgi:hypothetical protein
MGASNIWHKRAQSNECILHTIVLVLHLLVVNYNKIQINISIEFKKEKTEDGTLAVYYQSKPSGYAVGPVLKPLRTVRCKITGFLNILCNHRFFSATHGAFVASLNGMVLRNCAMQRTNSVGCVNVWRDTFVVKGCWDGKLGMLPASHTEWCSMSQPAHA